MPVTYVNNYPNVVIFSPKDPDSIVATYLIKDRYDNNLKNDFVFSFIFYGSLSELYKKH